MINAFFAGLVVAAQGEAPPVLSAVHRTQHLEIRYRPGSRAAASVDRTGAMAERDLARMAQALDLRIEGPFGLALYDDVRELELVTEVRGTGGFSAGRDSHVPYDNDQTRFHELVHVVAANCIPQTGPERRNLFFAEGLANALLEFVHGVPVHAVAKAYRKWGKLPPLTELTGADDFYEWLGRHPNFNAYDVGGSWLRFLLDTYGAAKVKRYYGGAPSRVAFGKSEADLERAWHAALDAFPLRSEVELLLRERNGEEVRFARYEPPRGIPREILGEPREWKPLGATDLRPERPGDWTRSDQGIVGAAKEPIWSVCELGTETYGDCAVRARICTPKPVPIQLRLGAKNQAMLVNGTFLYRDDGPVASSQAASMDAGRRETDLLLVRRGDSIEIWVDERKALVAPADPAPARVGIAVHGGRAVFEDIRVRRLD